MSTITTYKRAYHDYKIIDTIQAGIVLSGPEVKSIKSGHINLLGSYVTIDKNGMPFLINATIAPYPPAASAQKNYDPTQSRKLLLRTEEINSLMGKIKSRRVTLVPLKVYTKNGLIKIEIGLARGKKKHDKREALKKRDIDKKIKTEMKRYRQH